jgi:hypothetical protein
VELWSRKPVEVATIASNCNIVRLNFHTGNERALFGKCDRRCTGAATNLQDRRTVEGVQAIEPRDHSMTIIPQPAVEMILKILPPESGISIVWVMTEVP